MKIRSRITKWFGRDKPEQVKLSDRTRPARSQPVSMTRYDAAAINRHTQKHFQYADGRDADSVIRQSLVILRNRARYATRNNSYLMGNTLSKATSIVGTGPTLQIQTGDEELDAAIEKKFGRWAGYEFNMKSSIGACDAQMMKSLADILTLAGSKQFDDSGECLIVMSTDNSGPSLNRDRADEGVRFRLRVLEPDRLATPMGVDPVKVKDGIEYDANGAPVSYYILKHHPGGTDPGFGGVSGYGEYDVVPARFVIHLFRADRAEQGRGVPWIAPSIITYEDIRRYTSATISAAETAAKMSATMETVSDEIDEDTDIEAMDEIEIPRDSLLVMPEGYTVKQFDPTQPTSTFKEFKQEMLKEGAHCQNMPFHRASGDASEYNYASGRLDDMRWYEVVGTIRRWLERHIMNRVLAAWISEARLIPGFLPKVHLLNEDISAEWMWPGRKHADPVKEAMKQKIKLANGTTTLADEWAEQGQDWEKKLAIQAKVKRRQKELGLVEDGKRGKVDMEAISKAIRAGIPIGTAEVRELLGLPSEAPKSAGELLRFNDPEVLQYHIENGLLTINEARGVLGLEEVPWGNVPVRKNTVMPVETGKTEPETEDTDENETNDK